MVSPSPSTGPGRLRTGRELLLIGAALATALAIVFASRSLLDRYGLDCQDYANHDWQGQPFQTRVERDFSTPLFATRPARFIQSFSTECQGTLLIPRSGIYTFALVSRNRSEVLVDDLPLVQTQGVALQRVWRSMSLEAGQRRVRFRFANVRVADEPELLMARAGGALRPLNQAYVSRQPLPASAYWLRQPARAAVAMLPFLWIGFVVYRLRSPLARACRRISPPIVAWQRAVATRPRRALAVIVSVAAIVRVAFSFGSHAILWPDSIQYYNTALAFLRGDFQTHNLLSTPLFPAFMAVFLSAKIAPVAGAAMIATQRLLAVGATVLVYRLARDAFDDTTAFYAALLWSVSAVQLYYETVVSTEALFVVMLICTLSVGSWLLRRVSLPRSAALGLVCFVATMTRPVAKSLAMVVLAIMWWRAPSPRRRLIVPSIVLLGTFFVGITPWMYVNQQTYGFWGISRGEGLWLFLRAIDVDELDPPAETRFPEVRETFDALRPAYPYLHYAVRDELNYQRGYSASQADDAMWGFALETVMAHPFRFLAGTVKQSALLLVYPYRSVEICDSRDGPYLCSSRGQTLSFRAFPNTPPPGRKALKSGIAVYVRAAYWLIPILVPFALIGMVRSLFRRDDRGNLQVLFTATVLYFTVLTALFNTVQDRYRLPVEALITMFAIHEIRRLTRVRAPTASQVP